MSDPTDVRNVVSRGERFGLLGLWLLVTGWITLSAAGRIAPETKLALTWDPGRFLARAFSAWDPSAAFGGLQNQAVGYLAPMGIVTGAARAVGLPVWVTQRLWLALVLGAAMLGMHRLTTVLGVRGPMGRLTAATVYGLTPSFLMIASYHGGTALPHALAPWMLVPLIDHERLGPRRAALRSALAVAAMGGINAASTIAVLPLAVVWFLTRAPGRPRRILAAWWVGGVVAATAWWFLPFLVSVRHGFDFTPFTEQIDLTARTQSATDAWRGTGHWLTYIDQGGRVLQPGPRGLIVDARAIAGSMVLVVAGALGLTRRDAPGRRWLVPAAAVGAVALAAVYTGPGNAGPIAGALRGLLDGPLIAFRNVHKFSPLVQLPLAVGVGHLVSVLASARPPRLRLVPPVAVALTILASISPMIPGRLLLPGSFTDLPTAWRDTARWVDEGDATTRTLLLPGSIDADHRWGDPQDEPLGLLVDSTWAVRDIIPLGGNGSTRLLDGVDEALRRGVTPVGFTEALRRAGIGRLVVRNDLRSDADGAPSPETIRRALRATPGLVVGPSFGSIVEPDPEIPADLVHPAGEGTGVDSVEPIRRIDTYVVEDPVGRFETFDPTESLAVGGGPEALTLLPPDLVRDRPVLLADDRAGIEPAFTVSTDTARHRDVLFGGIRNNTSETLTIDETGPFSGGSPRDRWPDATPPPRTVAVLEGAQALEEQAVVKGASAGFRPPGWQPFAAFDHDPATFWVPASPALGRHLEIRFDEPRIVPSVTVTVPDVTGRHIAAIDVEHADGVTAGRIGADGSVRIELPAVETDIVRIRIAEVEDGPAFLPLGISEIDVEGVTVRRPLRTASPSPDGRGPADIAVLDRDRAGVGSIRGVDEDGILDRLVALTPLARELGGEAGAVGGPALDALMAELGATAEDPDRDPSDRTRPTDRTGPADPTGPSGPSASADPSGPSGRSGLPGPPAPTRVTGGSWHRLPGHGPAAAVDDSADTFWAVAPAPDPSGGALLAWDEPRPIRSLTFRDTERRGAAAFADVEVGITVDDVRTVLRPDASGRVELPSTLVTRQLHIDLTTTGSSVGLPITVGAIDLDDEPMSIPTIDPDRPIELACGNGPPLEVDGRLVPTSLHTTVGAIRRGEPAAWRACETVTAAGDETRFTAPFAEPFRIDTLIASPVGPDPSAQTDGTGVPMGADPGVPNGAVPVDRRAEPRSWRSQNRRIEVGAGDPMVLATTENANSGWAATLDGTEVESVRVDGWRQAFLVPASTGSADLRLAYAPNGPFRAGLLLGLALLIVLAIGAFVPVRRGRGNGPAVAERAPSRTEATVSAGLVGVLLGGVTAVIVVPLALLRRRDPGIVRRVLLLALGAVALLLLVPIGTRWASTNAAFHAPAQIAAVIAWIAFTLGSTE